MSGLDAKVERLEAEATERWGDQWVIETLRSASLMVIPERTQRDLAGGTRTEILLKTGSLSAKPAKQQSSA